MRCGRVKEADAYTCDRVVPALGIVALASCYGRGPTLSERGFHMSPPTALDSASSVACAAYRRLLIVAAAVASLLVLGVGAAAAASPKAGQPDFGPNVLIFDPSMPTSQIQSTVDAIAAQQVPNQFGSQRYA